MSNLITHLNVASERVTKCETRATSTLNYILTGATPPTVPITHCPSEYEAIEARRKLALGKPQIKADAYYQLRENTIKATLAYYHKVREWHTEHANDVTPLSHGSSFGETQDKKAMATRVLLMMHGRNNVTFDGTDKVAQFDSEQRTINTAHVSYPDGPPNWVPNTAKVYQDNAPLLTARAADVLDSLTNHFKGFSKASFRPSQYAVSSRTLRQVSQYSRIPLLKRSKSNVCYVGSSIGTAASFEITGNLLHLPAFKSQDWLFLRDMKAIHTGQSSTSINGDYHGISPTPPELQPLRGLLEGYLSRNPHANDPMLPASVPNKSSNRPVTPLDALHRLQAAPFSQWPRQKA